MHSKRFWSLTLGMLALLIMIGGCKPKQKPPVVPTPPPEVKPVTATLSANPTSIQPGGSSTLTWSTENATSVTLQGNKVDASGTQSVAPSQSTDYHLIAQGPGGTQEATARITIAQPQQQQTTQPPPLSEQELFTQTLVDVYFDYDSAQLRPDGQQTLAKAAQVINQHPNWKIQIEGNCDERGSTEYNLTLGEERASAAKQALSQAGVSADRLKTISYGKEKPICTQSTEDCMQKNRRDHFELQH
jgi:peptidoglycan-associated lipoprotein